MEGDTKYESTHKYWELAVLGAKLDPDEWEPAKLCEWWDAEDVQDERRARQAAGLEPPDPYVEERAPPPPPQWVQEAADRLCILLAASPKDEWRRLGEQIRATIWGDGRPAHRPASSSIAKRNARIVEQIKYWRAQGRPKKTIYYDVGRQYGLKPRAVKEIVANAASATEGHESPT